MMVCSLTFEQQAIRTAVSEWRLVNSRLQLIPLPVLHLLAPFFIPACLRYFLPPVVTAAAAILAGARYLQDIYELEEFRQAIHYLTAALFGIGYPRLSIDNGNKKLDAKEINLIDKIGGPGYLTIAPGNVVLFEKLHGISNVRDAGHHFIPRNETIKEIASLEDQHGYLESMLVTTKDGIRVNVSEIHYHYRLRAGRQAGDYTKRKPEKPYPFSVQAVRNMTYNRTVRENGITPWHDAVRLVVDGAISDYISQHKFDYLTTPHFHEDDPRLEIAKRLNSPGTRQRLKGLGAELLWFDIGHIEPVNKEVSDQKVGTWQARWIGNASVQRAIGEARLQANQELGRAEAQSEILVSILHSLDTVGLKDDPKNLRNIILLRTSQLLESLVYEDIKFLDDKAPDDNGDFG